MGLSSARSRLPGEGDFYRSFDVYEQSPTAEQAIDENVKRFVAAQVLSARLLSLATLEAEQERALKEHELETGVVQPDITSDGYRKHVMQYKKGALGENERIAHEMTIDKGQTGLVALLAAGRDKDNRKDDAAFADANMEYLRADAEKEMREDFAARQAAGEK